MNRPERERIIVVDYIADDCVSRDTRRTSGHINAKVHADGRGYVKIEGFHALYAKVVRIVIHDASEDLDL